MEAFALLSIPALLGLGLVTWQLDRRRRVATAQLREAEAENVRLLAEIATRKSSEQAKDRMFSIIAHDLRAPFSVLLGFASILRDEAGELTREQIERYSRSVHANGIRVLALLDNMLQWARLQMKRVKVVLSSQRLRALVGHMLEDLADTAAAKQVALENHVDDISVAVDPALLGTTLRNLVGNGIKFTPAGGKVVVRGNIDGESVLLEIADTGVGIAPDRLPGLFEPGTQRATVGTAGETGTGLGLLICKDLVELHGSRLEVESTQGSGTTFRFRLPLRDERSDAASRRAGDPSDDHELGETT